MLRLSMWRMMPFLLFTVIIVTACGNLAGEPKIVATLPAQATIEMPANPPDLVNGARIYQENCTRCHGLTGAGDGELVESGEVPRMISFLEPSAVRQESVESFYNMITNGNTVNLMPPWKESLTVQERWDVAMYLYTLHYTAEQIELGSQLVTDASSELRLESDIEIAAESTIVGDDAFGAVAYERLQSVQNWGQSAAATQELIVQDFEEFSVVGTVIHGTEGYTVPQGQSVELRYGNAEDGIQTLNTVIDSNNQYRFDNIPFNSTYQYVALIVYQGRNFFSEVLEGEIILETNEQEIYLYEVTEESNAVVLRGVDFIIEYLTVENVGTGLVITQQNIYENVTDRMFHIQTPNEGMMASILVQLPVGAVFLTDPNDPRFLQAPSEYALVDLRPVYPGFHTVETFYFIPYESGIVIDEPVNYRFEGDVNVVLTVPQLNVISENFERVSDEVNVGTADNPVMSKQYSATYDLAVGESIIIDIEGQVFSSSNTSFDDAIVTQEQIIPILLVIVAVSGIVILAVILMLRSRANNPQREIDNLLRQVAELENLHEAGRINHDAFQQKRQALREKIAQLMAENNEGV